MVLKFPGCAEEMAYKCEYLQEISIEYFYGKKDLYVCCCEVLQEIILALHSFSLSHLAKHTHTFIYSIHPFG
jgi:hypothetical protein